MGSSLSCHTSPAGHLQALSVRAQAEAGLPGALTDGPEEAPEEKPGEALVQVRDQRERGEARKPTRPRPPDSCALKRCVAFRAWRCCMLML